MDISRIFILVEFSRILRLVEFSGFLRCRIDISGNLRLVDLGRFPRFYFRFRFFKYSFYSRVLVLLVLLYTKLKFLLSLRRYSS